MKHKLIKISKPIWYLLIFLFIVSGTIALVRYGQGFIYDREAGEIVSGGLVLLSSSPRGANIYLDGESNSRSPSRLRLPRGEYHIEMLRDGFRPWRKLIEVEPGRVVNAEYPILIPNAISTTTLFAFNSLEFITQSNDQELLAYVDDGSVFILGVGEDIAEELFILPEGFEGHSINDLKWSYDDTRLLVVTSDSDNNQHYFLVNVSDGDYQDVSSMTDEDLGELHPSRRGSRSLNSLSGGELRSVNANNGSNLTVELLAENVSAFTELGSNIYAVINQEVVLLSSDGNNQPIYSIKTGRSYDIYSSNYDNSPVLILHDLDNKQLSILRNIDGEVATRTLPVGLGKYVDLSPARQFILMNNGSNLYATYNLNTGKFSRFLMNSDLESMPNWYSNHHLLTIKSGSATIMEYDGANLEDIITA
ncbi:MAG: PEGA domain-containing protein, partial [Candidatus Saccharimonadales bacterium]